MILTPDAQRLGIFFFFDSQGVVDRYVEVLLQDMTQHFSEFMVVVNGNLTPAGRDKLSAFTDNIIVRPNEGYDVWAYKTALDSYGWARLVEFDEVVLFNATIMGPVYPFAEMFTEMNQRDIDFWGITWFHQLDIDPHHITPEGYYPRHIQSHFHAYRRSLVSSPAFQDYWNNMGPITSYVQSAGQHEAPFTQRFERLGFKSDVYVNTEDMEGFTYHPVLFAAKELIATKRCPIFKRRSFFHEYREVLDQTVGNDSLELYEYLRDHTDFDTSLIWENLLRTVNLADLVNDLNLNLVLPAQVVVQEPEAHKIALVLHVYYTELLPSLLRYVKAMPPEADIIVTVGSEEKAARVREVFAEFADRLDVRLIENRGRDVSALLVGVKDIIFNYDLVCFLHDKKVTQLTPGSKGDGFADKCFENLAASPEFVKNVIHQFEVEPRLGMLTPPPPNHAEYFPVYTFSWGLNFQNTVDLMKQLGCQAPLDEKKEPITPLGTMFWFRPEALRPLYAKNWEYSDFPPEPNNTDGTILHAVERAYGYVTQSQGYYCAWLLSDSFAQTELTNLSFYLHNMVEGICTHQPHSTEKQMVEILEVGNLQVRRVLNFIYKLLPRGIRPALGKLYRKIRGRR